MIATALAAALCGANAVLWATMIAAARATDREAAVRMRLARARAEVEAGLISVESYRSMHNWDAGQHARDTRGRFAGGN